MFFFSFLTISALSAISQMVCSSTDTCQLDCTSNVSCNRSQESDGACIFDEYKVPIPPNVEAVITEDWDNLDSQGKQMMERMRQINAINQFAYARQVFRNHLIGTFSTLRIWKQPDDVCRLGLFHTGYSGDLFHFYVLDAGSDAERSDMRSIVGDDAEYLIYLFGGVQRGDLLHLSDAMNTSLQRVPDYLIHDKNYTIGHRIQSSVSITSKEIAKLMVVTIADYLDQMVSVNGWRDHHQVETPLALYPGNGKPAVALYWMSAMCRAIRSELDVVPPLFNHCQDVVSYQDEVAARDWYWKVVTEEEELSTAEQKQYLAQSISSNRYVAEPEIMLAQLLFREGDFEQAAAHSASALRKLYTLGSAYDKRRDYSVWVRLLASCFCVLSAKWPDFDLFRSQTMHP